MALKKWGFQKVDKQLANELANECDVDPMIALLLSGRGFTDPYDIETFVFGDEPLCDPFELPDMDRAVERIQQAFDRNEMIAVCGDYDADGVTASALLYTYLHNKGCRVVCEIPERLEEGYGLHNSIIDRLHQQGVALIITVDNGIGCVDEIAHANALGIDVVITDHHRPGVQLPPAVAVVDPYVDPSSEQFVGYAGVGVAFKLVCALEGCACEEMLEEYGDLVAIGTVADVVPLVDENRLLVQRGLTVLNRQERLGLRELIDAADIMSETLGADQIAYGIAPRINAAGRMGRSFRAFELLTTDDVNEARLLAAEICHENLRRQDVEAVVSDTCRILHYQSGIHFYDRVIVIADYNWHHGVLGIVAARLCSQFGKPVIVLSVDGDVAKGSARSLEGFDLFAALSSCSDVLLQFGGHTLAAGLTIDTSRIDEFRERINRYACSQGDRPIPALHIDCKLSPLGAGESTANAIRALAPHGCQNPVPVFALMNMELNAVQPVGGGRSLRLTLSRDGTVVICMKFGMGVHDFPFQVGDVIDLAVVFRYSTYKNRPAFSLVVQDVRPAGFDDEQMFADLSLFESFMAGESLNCEQQERLLPNRDDLGIVYRFIRSNPKMKISPSVFLMRTEYAVPLGKILVALKVFEEFGFIEWFFDGECLQITFLHPDGKFDLTNSEILLKLRS